jgi:hypothetical protein
LSERDAFLEHMENRSGCCDYDEPENDNFEQTVRSAVASFYHTNLVNLIHERIGDGEPMDKLLADSFYRSKFNMKARVW